jgi:hypothetical protein
MLIRQDADDFIRQEVSVTNTWSKHKPDSVDSVDVSSQGPARVSDISNTRKCCKPLFCQYSSVFDARSSGEVSVIVCLC